MPVQLDVKTTVRVVAAVSVGLGLAIATSSFGAAPTALAAKLGGRRRTPAAPKVDLPR